MRVSDGSRVRAVQCGDFSVAVAWAPHAMVLAFATEDSSGSNKADWGAVHVIAV